MTSDSVRLDLSAKDIVRKHIILHVTTRGAEIAKLRLRVGVLIVRLAAWVMGVGIEVDA